MPALRLPAALTGIRAKALVAPALILVLTAALGLASLSALSGAADRSAASERAAAAIETLRDSNSRQFESDRLQYLALRATTPKDAHDAAAESLLVLKESADGYRAFAARSTGAARAGALRQAGIISAIAADRRRVLAWRGTVAAGTPVPASVTRLIDALEARVDSADELNDTLATAQTKLDAGLVKDAHAAERSGGGSSRAAARRAGRRRRRRPAGRHGHPPPRRRAARVACTRARGRRSSRRAHQGPARARRRRPDRRGDPPPDMP